MMMKRILFLVVVAAVVLMTVLIWSQHRLGPLKVSGFIEADEIRLGSRVGGRVQAVHVEEGAAVEAGAVLMTLEPFDLKERRAQAAAQAVAAQARYDRLAAGFRAEEIAQAVARRDQLSANLRRLVNGPREEDIAAAQARVELAEAKCVLAQQQYDRTMAAAKQGAANPIEIEQKTSALKVAQADVLTWKEDLAKLQTGSREEDIAQARAQLEEAEQALRLVQNGYRDEEIAEARASLEAAEAELALIERRMEELTVSTPLAGVVESIDLEPGDLVAADAPVILLLDSSTMWVRAYVPENHLDLKLGQRVALTVDSYPAERFNGQITFIARGAEFTPRNVQTPDERSKQVFRIKVTIVEGIDRLRPGMAADVWLEGDPADAEGAGT